METTLWRIVEGSLFLPFIEIHTFFTFDLKSRNALTATTKLKTRSDHVKSEVSKYYLILGLLKHKVK